MVASAVLDQKHVTLQKEAPPRKSGIRVFHIVQPFERTMISLNAKLTAHKIRMEGLHSHRNRQTLLLHRRVLFLSWEKFVGARCYWLIIPLVVKLTEYSPQPSVDASVCTMNSFLKSGLMRTGPVHSSDLRAWNATSHSTDHRTRLG